MAAKAITLEDVKNANFEVIEDGRGTHAVHEVVVAMQAARRSGSANTKSRGEVAGSNKKPWRQKGTGRARSGRTSSPIWRGGGVVFGPKPRDYTKTVPKGVKRMAFRKAVSERIKDGDVFSAPTFSIEDGKTKSFVAEVAKLSDAKRTLIIGAEFDEKTKLAGRNVKSVLLMSAAEVNVENLLYYDRIILLDSAMETLAARTA